MLAVANATTQPVEDAPWYVKLMQGPYVLIAGMLVVLMLFSGKGKRNAEEKQRAEMLKQLKRGDRIQTIGGIQGAVTRAEESRVEVKVDESSNTKIWFARTAIAKVIEQNDKPDKEKAEKEKAEAK